GRLGDELFGSVVPEVGASPQKQPVGSHCHLPRTATRLSADLTLGRYTKACQSTAWGMVPIRRWDLPAPPPPLPPPPRGGGGASSARMSRHACRTSAARPTCISSSTRGSRTAFGSASSCVRSSKGSQTPAAELSPPRPEVAELAPRIWQVIENAPVLTAVTHKD